MTHKQFYHFMASKLVNFVLNIHLRNFVVGGNKLCIIKHGTTILQRTIKIRLKKAFLFCECYKTKKGIMGTKNFSANKCVELTFVVWYLKNNE